MENRVSAWQEHIDASISARARITAGRCRQKQEKKKAPKPKAVTGVSEDKILCPECGEPLAFEGGCNVCKNCGWSKCY